MQLLEMALERPGSLESKRASSVVLEQVTDGLQSVLRVRVLIAHVVSLQKTPKLRGNHEVSRKRSSQIRH